MGKLVDHDQSKITITHIINDLSALEFNVGSEVNFNAENMKLVTLLKLYRIRDIHNRLIGHGRIIPCIVSDTSMVKIILTESFDQGYTVGQVMMWSKVLIEGVQTLGEGKKKKGRGRKRGLSPDTWTKTKRTTLRVGGKAYKSTAGRLIAEKEMVFVECGNGCKNNCSTSLPVEDRNTIFKMFYGLGNELAQNTFIKNNVIVKAKARTKVGTSRRQNTREYRLNTKKVCKCVFLKTLAISNGRTARVVTSENIGDGRGKHGNHATVHASVKTLLNEVMMKLPRYDSHYHDTYSTDTNDIFLAPHLTIISIFDLLKEEIVLHDTLTEADIPSIQWFQRAFQTEYPNIKISNFKKDTCDTCNIHKINGTSSAEHLRQVEMAKQLYEHDAAKDYTLTSDMMAVVPLPKLDTNTVYYKRQLSVYTQGVHWTKHNQGYCYLWLEDEAHKGSTEVITVINKFITENPQVYEDSRTIILWTDTPSSQNRNYALLMYFIWCVNSVDGLDRIIHRYFVKGHSYMACDRDFGHVKKMLNNQRFIYTKEDYVKLMEKANSKTPLKITSLETSDFMDFTSAMNFELTSKKTLNDNEGSKFYISKCRELVFKKGEMTFHFKYDWEEDLKYVTLPTLNNKELRDHGMLFEPPTPCLETSGWLQSLGISQEKYNDLQLLKSFIPSNLHSFYDQRKIKPGVRGGHSGRGSRGSGGR